jgi:AraC-like DNA-binding protein
MHRIDTVQSVPYRLRPWVSRLWVSQGAAEPRDGLEHVLPTGQMHLVFRLSGPPLRLLHDGRQPIASTVHGPVIGGPRTRFYAKAVDGPVASIGAVLRPGAAMALFGASADELAERHTPLADVLGASAAVLHEQLALAPDTHQQLALLSQWLITRTAHAGAVDPMVQHALAGMARPGSIEALVRASHFSHRGFLVRFKQATGMGPKRLARLMRFQRLLIALRADGSPALGELALDIGYSDQSHMNREFRAMAGVTPQQYRALAPAHAHHVRLRPAR